MSAGRDRGVDHDRALLEAADRGARRLSTRPPTVADLERRSRRRTAGATALALAAVVVAIAASQVALRAGAGDAGGRSTIVATDSPATATLTGSITDSSRAVDRSLDAALAWILPTPPAAREIRALGHARRSTSAGFRALHRAAEAGDGGALDDLRWLAERFPDDHDGRCARAYLASRGTVETEGPRER